MKLSQLIQFKSSFRLLIFQLFVLLILNSCSDNSNSPVEVKFDESGTKAIVIFVENSYIISPELNDYYPDYKADIDKLLSNIFNLRIEALQPLQLDEIVETYGEEWQIRQIRSVAENHYDRIVVLTDSTAKYSSFIDSLSTLSKSFSAIDVVLNTHGTNRAILFGDDLVGSDIIADDLHNRNINVRAIYQTCCYGASTIADFENAGIYCINGSVGKNLYSLFSAKLFLEKWCNGATYSSAVQWAFSREPIEIQNRTQDNPIAMYYFNFSKQQIDNSRQQVGGKFANLLYNQIKPIQP